MSVAKRKMSSVSSRGRGDKSGPKKMLPGISFEGSARYPQVRPTPMISHTRFMSPSSTGEGNSNDVFEFTTGPNSAIM